LLHHSKLGCSTSEMGHYRRFGCRRQPFACPLGSIRQGGEPLAGSEVVQHRARVVFRNQQLAAGRLPSSLLAELLQLDAANGAQISVDAQAAFDFDTFPSAEGSAGAGIDLRRVVDFFSHQLRLSFPFPFSPSTVRRLRQRVGRVDVGQHHGGGDHSDE
jgi:hypothetical protein